MNVDNLSLDQLRVFAAVVEDGTFSGAARRFGRAQSAVSYAISTLEQQLGVTLFDRAGYRPILTPAGQVLAGEIADIVARTDRLKSQAQSIARGLEPEVAIVADVMFPIEEIGRLLKNFQQAFPTVSVRVFVETLGGVAELVLNGTCVLGILATLPGIPPALSSYAMTGILTLPVASPDHLLAALPAPVPNHVLRDQVQIVLADRSEFTKGLDFGVLSHKTWRVSDLGAKLRLLREGLGWGTMPAHVVADELSSGRLKVLHLESITPPGEVLPVNAVHRTDAVLGPAASWMLKSLKELGTRLDGAHGTDEIRLRGLPYHPNSGLEAAT
jgi:DNA-binding transcriptional LysR family regulator